MDGEGERKKAGIRNKERMKEKRENSYIRNDVSFHIYFTPHSCSKLTSTYHRAAYPPFFSSSPMHTNSHELTCY